MAKNSTEATAAVATIEIGNTEAGMIAHGSMNIPSGEFEMVSGNYLKFEVGQTYNVVCLGLIDATDFNDKTRIVPEGAASLVTSNGVEVVNQDVVMMSTVKKLKEQGKTFPCILRIYNNGVRQNAKGKEYADLQIGYRPITQDILNAIGVK